MITNVGNSGQDSPSPQRIPPPPTLHLPQHFSYHLRKEVAPGVSEEDMQEIGFKRNTTPPSTRSVRKHCPSFPWLSVLLLLVEREEEQGYTGRHSNGACHAR